MWHIGENGEIVIMAKAGEMNQWRNEMAAKAKM
jgi:hypothetical protein